MKRNIAMQCNLISHRRSCQGILGQHEGVDQPEPGRRGHQSEHLQLRGGSEGRDGAEVSGGEAHGDPDQDAVRRLRPVAGEAADQRGIPFTVFQVIKRCENHISSKISTFQRVNWDYSTGRCNSQENIVRGPVPHPHIPGQDCQLSPHKVILLRGVGDQFT